jgi:YebC/PmpR family DNA-binding regulatory protein
MGRHGTIAGRKAAQDAKRGALFTKYARLIIQAAKTGGGDPGANSSLRNAIDKARSINMPNDKIQNAIKRGTGELQGETLTASTFEGYGAGGVAVIVDVLTDNANRATSAVKNIFTKNGGNIGVPGCVSYMFNRKGIINVEKKDSIDEEKLMDIALESGADDFNDDSDFYEIITSTESFQPVLDAIKAAGYEPDEADIELVADMEIEPKDDAARKAIERLVETLEENDDVQKVYTNAK